MTTIVLLPLLNIKELARFRRLNKACNQLMIKYVIFEVLFEAWGFKLSPTEVAETKISPFSALQVAAKYIMIRSLINSSHIIPNYCVYKVRSTFSIPDRTLLANMSLQELRNFTITQVEWGGFINTLGFTLSDGETCKDGTTKNFNKSHVFDQ